MSIRHKEDYERVQKYLSGNMVEQERAGYELFADTYDYLLRYLNNKYGNQINNEDKEDLVGDTLYTCIECMDRYNGSSSFKTWICGILNNKIRNYFRKNQNKDINIDEIINESSNAIIHIPSDLFGRNPLSIIIEREAIEAYYKAFEMLSPDYQNIIKYKENGMKTKQIAMLSGKSIEAVDSMHYKAKKAIKNNFRKIYKM